MAINDSTLLIVEDEQAIRESIVAYFEDSGYRILEASNGSEGLSIFESKQPDLVICDLRMPGIDGLQLLSNIMDQSDETPVIVVSGAGVMTDVVEALRLGAADYLMKPVVDLQVLEHSVERALERSLLVKDNLRYRAELEKRNQELQDHVDRLKLDLQAGRAVQQQLLPRYTLTQGKYEVRHDMEPSTYLSGDLVDYFELDPSTIVFYIADVSGHGASSALITLLIKTQISRYRAEYENGTSDLISSPGPLLRQINLELLKTQTNKHATLFYGILNTVEDRMTYSMAAHFPSPIISREGGCETIEPEALAVGLFEDASYETRKLDMKGFKSLTLLSDGIFELMEDETLAEKEDRLLELGAQPTHTMYDYLAKLRENGQTMNAPDDITVLTVEKS
ncbi:response regulator [Reinekea marinisedimentorum]|uniref:Stage II sporulation protein E n=1 Tax=Reinekea marinisedimentorum TaxID=230495 RepID=A0A4R3I2E7_9GAMM|nr:response regulator [Reinekea marinisedimentorum]TCS39937.1 stage II sporulation protein E [Reinekea marinisedimentorum]